MAQTSWKRLKTCGNVSAKHSDTDTCSDLHPDGVSGPSESLQSSRALSRPSAPGHSRADQDLADRDAATPEPRRLPNTRGTWKQQQELNMSCLYFSVYYH